MFKSMFVAVCMVMLCAVTACSQKPSEIRTYRELLSYSAAAMKAYKDASRKYASLLKDLITVMGDKENRGR